MNINKNNAGLKEKSLKLHYELWTKNNKVDALKDEVLHCECEKLLEINAEGITKEVEQLKTMQK